MSRKKLLGSIPIIVIVCSAAIVLFHSSITPSMATPRELDFTVTGMNACLRFLNSSVSTVYIPIATGANENWELTIDATKMAGSANGWVDYIHITAIGMRALITCLSKDIYPILAGIKVPVHRSKHEPYTQTFGGETPQAVRYSSFSTWGTINLP